MYTNEAHGLSCGVRPYLWSSIRLRHCVPSVSASALGRAVATFAYWRFSK